LKKAGCRSKLHLFENSNHVWMLTDIASYDSRKALLEITIFLKSLEGAN
jgi:hypothetical protein